MRISINSGAFQKHLDLNARYEAIAAAGFTAIDWSLYYSWNVRSLNFEGTTVFERSLDEVIAAYSEEISIIRKNGLALAQAHAPFPAYIPGHPEVTDFCIKTYSRMIELCDYVGCPILVIHGIDQRLDSTVDTPADIARLNEHLFTSLIPTLQKCNVTVCLENLYVRNNTTSNCDNFLEGHCSDPYAAAALIDSLNQKAGKEVFGLCLDTGHMHIVAKDPRTYIPLLGKRIKALHLNDNNGHADQHYSLLSGTAQWSLICEAMKDIGYHGDVNFEISGHAEKILNFDKDLLLPWLKMVCKTGECFRNKIQR